MATRRIRPRSHLCKNCSYDMATAYGAKDLFKMVAQVDAEPSPRVRKPFRYLLGDPALIAGFRGSCWDHTDDVVPRRGPVSGRSPGRPLERSERVARRRLLGRRGDAPAPIFHPRSAQAADPGGDGRSPPRTGTRRRPLQRAEYVCPRSRGSIARPRLRASGRLLEGRRDRGRPAPAAAARSGRRQVDPRRREQRAQGLGRKRRGRSHPVGRHRARRARLGRRYGRDHRHPVDAAPPHRGGLRQGSRPATRLADLAGHRRRVRLARARARTLRLRAGRGHPDQGRDRLCGHHRGRRIGDVLLRARPSHEQGRGRPDLRSHQGRRDQFARDTSRASRRTSEPPYRLSSSRSSS